MPAPLDVRSVQERKVNALAVGQSPGTTNGKTSQQFVKDGVALLSFLNIGYTDMLCIWTMLCVVRSSI